MTIDELRARIAELDASVAGEAGRACGSHFRTAWRDLFRWHRFTGLTTAQEHGATPQQAQRWLVVHREIQRLEGEIARIERAERLAPRPRAA